MAGIKSKKTGFIIFLMLIMLLFSGCGEQQDVVYQTELNIWGLFDDSSLYADLIEQYKGLNQYVSAINYMKFTPNNYRDDLVESMISRTQPEIYLIHSTWLPYFKDKISPAPKNVLGENEFRYNFVDVAASDLIEEGEIYGVPLSIDSLALYYNKDMFNAEGITSPPATWEEFNEYVKKFTKIDKYGNITQAGAAMGTAYNINRSTDLLGVLMMQNGAQMTDADKKTVAFNNRVTIDGVSVNPGENALEYYTQFARSNSPLYTWNSNMHYSIDSFAEGTAAMMINYLWNYDNIKNKNAKLNFEVAQLPQLYPDHPVNYANYWVFVVDKNKDPEVVHEAWQFLKFLTTQNNGNLALVNGLSGASSDVPVEIDPAKEYFKEKKGAAARKDIIEEQKNDYVISPFAYGNLIAKSWYQPDSGKVESILAEAINSVNIGNDTVKGAINIAANRITQLFPKE